MMLPRQTALVLAQSPDLAHNVATCIGAFGGRVHVLGDWSQSSFRLSRYWVRYQRVEADLFEPGAIGFVALLRRYCQGRRIDVIVPADESTTRALLAARPSLGGLNIFPLPSWDTFERLADKWSFAAIAADAGVDQPQTWLIERSEQLDALRLVFPVVVKPPRGSNTQGVYVIRSAENLRLFVKECALRNALPYLVQEYIDGEDLDLTILADHGRICAWTLQRRDLTNGAVEFFVDDELLEIGSRIAAQCNFHGILDLDLRADQRRGRKVVIEANPRFPGSLRFKLWAGVNFVELGLRLLAGRSGENSFQPPLGRCVDIGVSPRLLLRSVCRRRWPTADLSPHTRAAWASSWSDPIPHMCNWLFRFSERQVKQLRGQHSDKTPVHVAREYKPRTDGGTAAF